MIDAQVLDTIGDDWTPMGHTGSPRLRHKGPAAPRAILKRLAEQGLVEVRTVTVSYWGPERWKGQPQTWVEARRAA